jgi:peptide/nickel transport system substrate-binding protein
MKLRTIAYLAFASAATLALSGQNALAEDRCVKIAVFETRGEKQSSDPVLLTDTDDAATVTSIYERLWSLDTSFQPHALLAESWESNADATVWTIHVRKGVKFHDGAELTANDVVYTYKRILDPESGSKALSDFAWLDPAGIKVLDKYTVQFTTKKPVAEMPVLLSSKFALIVRDGATSKQLAEHPVGTGPFMVETFKPGQPVLVLKKNRNYWQAGLPKADCVAIIPITEPIGRVAALRSGQVDMDLVVDPTSIPTLKEDPHIKLLSTPGGYALEFCMQIDKAPFNDVRVRKALKLVVDRQAMVQISVLGFGEAGNDNTIPPSRVDAYRHDPIPQNIAEAKKLLADAGYADGLKVELYTAKHFPGIDLAGQAYAQMAKEAGIDVKIIDTPADSYWDEIWLKRPFYTSYLAPRPTGSALALSYRSSSNQNETNWLRPDYDALLDEANATVDPAKRAKVYQKAQMMLTEEGGVIVPVFAGVTAAVRDNCSGYTPHIDTNRMDLRNVSCQ